jgi:hypothetical protein
MEEDTIEDIGAEVLSATASAGSAAAEGPTKKRSQAGIEEAVERTMKDLVVEATREPRARS